MTAVADDIDTGLFGPHSVTWRVHLEPVLYVGGFRALILQALHPWVMLGTYQNSALFDPAKAFARFVRTAEFVGIRTYGTTSEVEAAAGRVRRLHAKLRGHDPATGRAFRLDDPQGLLWVHCGEIDSYVDVAVRAGILDDADADRYVAESVRAAEIVGSPDAPRSRAELKAYFDEVRPRLRLTEEAITGTVNLLTGYPAELLPWLAEHADVNALDLTGATREERVDAERAAAGTVKRVFAPRDEDFAGAPGTARIRAFLETKSVWHPTGSVSIGGGTAY